MVDYLGHIYYLINASWAEYVNGGFAWVNGSVVAILDAIYYGS